MDYLSFIYAFISTAGFSVLFNIPKDCIVKASFIGAFGWTIYSIIPSESTIITAFFASLAIGILGEIFSRIFKEPVTIFIIPGIIPIVPGYGLYYTMLKIIEKDYQSATNIGFESIIVAILIASGLMVSASISKLIQKKV